MKELLTEFLSNLLSEKKPSGNLNTPDPKPPEAKFSHGGKWYSDSDHKQYVGRMYQGKWVPATAAEKEQEKNAADLVDKGVLSRDVEPERFMSKGTQQTPDSQPTEPAKKQGRGRKTKSGAVVYDVPIETPQGNKINATISSKELKPVVDGVNAEVDKRRSVTADLADVTPDQAKGYAKTKLSESDEEYYSRMGDRVRNPPNKFPKEVVRVLLASGVPYHHVQLLERSANTILVEETEPKFSELTGGNVGAGKPRSQSGELLALTLMAVPPDQRQMVADTVREMVGDEKNMMLETHGSKSWLEAGLRQADAATAILDSQYGPGNWRIEATAWDTPSDISGIGLSEENKGFSTDVALRVRIKGMDKAQALRLSLKKDGDIFLLNGTTGDIIAFSLQSLSPEEQQKVATINRLLSDMNNRETKAEAKKQLAELFGLPPSTSDAKLKEIAKTERATLQDIAIQQLDPKTRERVQLVRDFPQTQQQSAVDLSVGLVGTGPLSEEESAAMASAWDQRRKAAGITTPIKEKDLEFALKVHAIISRLPKGTPDSEIRNALEEVGIPAKSDERFRKAMVYASEIESGRNPDHAEKLKVHMQLAVDAGNAAIDAAVEDPQLLQGLMLKLQETFPIRVIASGEESMCLGGVPVSAKTLEAMFGTSNPDEIKDGLQVVTNAKGVRILIFRAEARGINIPIATVQARQKGRGYDGTIGMEFQAAPDFECASAKANKSTGMNSASNQRIIQKCEKRGKEKKPTTKGKRGDKG